jgi:hypothetical protein
MKGVEMDFSQSTWQTWTHKLQEYGLADLTASILEAGAPLAVLGAQAVYVSQPVLTAVWPRLDLNPLTHLLEEDASYRAFIGGLRKTGER